MDRNLLPPLLASALVVACTGSVPDEITSEIGLGKGDGVEICNRFDDDGDGLVDEGCRCRVGTRQACFPGPGELLVGACARGEQQCVADGASTAWGPCKGAVTPKPEICGDGIDQDCDGADAPCGGSDGGIVWPDAGVPWPDLGAPPWPDAGTAPGVGAPCGTYFAGYAQPYIEVVEDHACPSHACLVMQEPPGAQSMRCTAGCDADADCPGPTADCPSGYTCEEWAFASGYDSYRCCGYCACTGEVPSYQFPLDANCIGNSIRCE